MSDRLSWSQEDVPMITIILVVLLVLLLAGGGWGYRTGQVSLGNPIGILLVVVLVVLLVGLIGGPRLGAW
jgi:hypothetical protein